MKVIRKEILVGAGIVLAALCICTVLLYVVLVRPRTLQLAEIGSKLAARQAELDSLSPDRMRALLAQAEKKRSELSDYVVLAGMQGELSIRLRQLASANKLDAFSVKETPTGIFSAESIYTSEQRMRVVFTGDFIGFARFVRALENNRPVVFVDGFKVAHMQEDPTRISAEIDSSVLNEAKK
jgi:hypothetical protein